MCAGKDGENELLEILNKVLTCQTRSHRRNQPIRMHRRATPHPTPRNYLRSVIDEQKLITRGLIERFAKKQRRHVSKMMQRLVSYSCILF